MPDDTRNNSTILFDSPKFDEFARKLFGPEPHPDTFPFETYEWRTCVSAAYRAWIKLGLMCHEGKLPFAPREGE